jgi:hypothetical protein
VNRCETLVGKKLCEIGEGRRLYSPLADPAECGEVNLMPMLSCLFGRATEDVLTTLRADPSCCQRLHQFKKCEGVDLPSEGLAVVHLEGTVTPLWFFDEAGVEPTRAQYQERSGHIPEQWIKEDMKSLGLLKPPLIQHRWLAEALPPPRVVARWADIARTTGRHLAWWWWWERGDSLYADASWLFAPEAQSIVVRETHLVADGDQKTLLYTKDEGVTSVRGYPFSLAMRHLGLKARCEYFPPAESWNFDWTPFRYL